MPHSVTSFVSTDMFAHIDASDGYAWNSIHGFAKITYYSDNPNLSVSMQRCAMNCSYKCGDECLVGNFRSCTKCYDDTRDLANGCACKTGYFEAEPNVGRSCFKSSSTCATKL